MMVYLTTAVGPNEIGFYYWDNPSTTWIPIANNSKNSWKTTGNSGTDSTINFIGTNDTQDVNFRRNAIHSGRIGNVNTSFGYFSLPLSTTGVQNSALGRSALENNTTGNGNVALGYQSLNTNTSGNDNIGIGRNSLFDNLDGINNVGVGTNSLVNNISGYQNHAFGMTSLTNNTTGNNNIGLGTSSLFQNQTGSANIAIGVFSQNKANNGTNNITIGANSQTNGSANLSITNATAIGTNAIAEQDNAMVLGSINGVNSATASVNVGIGTTTPQDRLHVVGSIRMVDGNQAVGRVLTSNANGTATWTNPSSISSGTLDQAYDFGGAGNGRTITADTGPLLINGIDGILSTGTVNSGTLAPTGLGVRMLWYPRKAAFRAGQVTDTSWDDANIGFGSTAFGTSTRASGGNSFACGLSTIASGLFSFAFGSGATSSGDYSFAGSHATASNVRSFAFGSNTVSSGLNSVALGYWTTASGDDSFAVGSGIASGTRSIAMGWSSNASGQSATAIGANNTASANYATALGSSTMASGEGSLTFGFNSEASGLYSTAFGIGSLASSQASTAFGFRTTASGPNSTALGTSNTAPSYGETVIGIGATNYIPSALGFNLSSVNDRLFVIGNAIDTNFNNLVDTSERSDAMVVLKNGNTGIGSSTPQDKLHVVGNIRMVDGNQAVGKVLTSDANGTATWQNASTNAWGLTGNGNTNVTTNFIGTTNVQSLAFRTFNIERMRITSLGDVGIGTTVPGGQFELSLNEGRKPTSNTWIIPSDARLKTVNGPYKKGLSDILKLKPISYNYINTEKRTFEPEVLQKEAYGYLAQEVKEVFPEAVDVDPDGYYNFDLHPILIAYTNALKEVSDRILKLENENEQQKKKN
ncbi:tail fiber domain-containing protein [Flavobacterium piscinae]|uniref:tail fiber domain-containing protein n=1 Tax=Flavobacterium piscinae TaxID=2506424 RepID=UPI0019B29C44|nr:tail fiber domain-containing protein [Flavobacterium piscinae]MBC8883910.1 tail fiber domain-containing protein [Flavobacterium piscinae]